MTNLTPEMEVVWARRDLRSRWMRSTRTWESTMRYELERVYGRWCARRVRHLWIPSSESAPIVAWVEEGKRQKDAYGEAHYTWVSKYRSSNRHHYRNYAVMCCVFSADPMRGIEEVEECLFNAIGALIRDKAVIKSQRWNYLSFMGIEEASIKADAAVKENREIHKVVRDAVENIDLMIDEHGLSVRRAIVDFEGYGKIKTEHLWWFIREIWRAKGLPDFEIVSQWGRGQGGTV